ncbi:hypothetical protein GCM10010222_43920 [Streptomyces tanashiensis]|nr:hypothetical protein GCM10010222_43920 [Streptomyces tanashiensis]
MPAPVERLAADQAARIDIGLHGPSNWSQLLYTPTKVHNWDVGHLSDGSRNLAGRLVVAVDPVRESPPEKPSGGRRRSKSSPESLRPLYRADEVTLESRADADGISLSPTVKAGVPRGVPVKLSG